LTPIGDVRGEGRLDIEAPHLFGQACPSHRFLADRQAKR
jgi:hypothetical protein